MESSLNPTDCYVLSPTLPFLDPSAYGSRRVVLLLPSQITSCHAVGACAWLHSGHVNVSVDVSELDGGAICLLSASALLLTHLKVFPNRQGTRTLDAHHCFLLLSVIAVIQWLWAGHD